ncbi:MAG: nuclear transport factor 2 family protein [Mucilaginibacter sp.]|jgi:ketosteroid isomerase-like protein|nr:nuclear transport factor 2 family protein [Mucilaginibacter sp.]
MSTQVETTKAQEVAHRLVDLCREGRNVDAINELYDDNVVSIEPESSPMPGKTVGKKAVLESTNHWFSSVQEIHSAYISDPIVSDNFFACTMDIDATYKEHGRNEMNELCVFEVKNGKIVASQFFYNAGN